MSDTYTTIIAPAEASCTEKRSKFLAFAYPVQSAAQAKEYVSALEKEYFDARHVCWAYMLGPDRLEFRANDNGEPSGTAGKPILGQINSLGLTDVLVAVVRYFGGIKLGTSGLIVAYREAARLVLAEAVTEQRHVTVDIHFTFPYVAMNDVMKLTRLEGVKITDSQFDNTCSMTLQVERDRSAAIIERLTKTNSVTLT